MSKSMSKSTHFPVVIIGGGQAGLSVSWYLGRAGVEHVVLEADTPFTAWTRRWDHFTLVTPNWHCRLPGYDYAGPEPDGFMTLPQVLEWLAGWLRTFDPPLRTHTRATSLIQREQGGFELTVEGPDGEETLTADDVVIATGGYPNPVIPPFAAALDPAITQVDADTYGSPDRLPEGAVLVVGTGQSGTQIAEDLHLAGRRVHLALGDAPRVARRYRGRDCMTWLAEMGLYYLPVEQYPGGRTARDKSNHYVTGREGGRDIDLRRFASEGMRLYGVLTGGKDDVLSFEPTLTHSLNHADSVYNSICSDIDTYIEREGLEVSEPPSRYEPVWTPAEDPTTLNLAEAGIRSIVWAIGYRPDYRWIEIGVFDGAGRPAHYRGITSVPGLSFIGLPWMHTWGSGRFLGLDRDAAHVARTILNRNPATDRTLSGAGLLASRTQAGVQPAA